MKVYLRFTALDMILNNLKKSWWPSTNYIISKAALLTPPLARHLSLFFGSPPPCKDEVMFFENPKIYSIYF